VTSFQSRSSGTPPNSTSHFRRLGRQTTNASRKVGTAWILIIPCVVRAFGCTAMRSFFVPFSIATSVSVRALNSMPRVSTRFQLRV